MASITIRNLDDPIKKRLRIRAAHHGRSMEEEVRSILRAALIDGAPNQTHVVDAVRGRFAPLGGVDLPEPQREALRPPPEFEA